MTIHSDVPDPTTQPSPDPASDQGPALPVSSGSLREDGAPRRRRLAPEDKRAAVVRAALELFDERTFGATPVPEVARRAGVGTGTVYRFFESKEALGNAVFQAGKLEMQRFLEAGLDPAAPPREGFRALWWGLWRFASEHPATFRFLETQKHAAYLDERSRAVSDAVFRRASEFVLEAQLQGAVRPGDPGRWIALAFGAFVGLVKEAEQGHLTLDDRAIADTEVAVWAMLAAPGSEGNH